MDAQGIIGVMNVSLGQGHSEMEAEKERHPEMFE